MKFLFLESFFGGSHKDFVEGLISHSKHSFDLMTLPARFWKWRMRGAALYFYNNINNLECYNGIVVTDLMSLSDFKALAGAFCPPTLVYFHENQLTYPLAPGEEMDYQYGFTDITTALVADRILFNSKTHWDDFFATLPGFLRMMPEYRPHWVIDKIRAKAGVLHPGCRFPLGKKEAVFSNTLPPLIVWNHRWEFDKNAKGFFNALDALVQKKIDFRLALLGENFQSIPQEFIDARDRFKKKIVQYGYVRDKNDYFRWLREGAVVISTAVQENFGISVIEAIRHGCLPLLPKRLVYPEIIPEPFHREFLYENQEELIDKLIHVILNYPKLRDKIESISDCVGRYAWENVIDSYDQELERLASISK